jgi:uncharacterized membrane protein YsdA (DUF1294 family)/cold shock CspA family protein
MRYQGKITSWKDDQGFGFVTQNGGSEKVFLHIKSFSSRARRPVEGDLITYELAIDERHRFRAASARFVGSRAASAASAGTGSLGSIFAVMFCSFLVLTSLLGRLPLAVLGAYLAASAIAFVAYALDKSAAQKNRWRISERTLHLFGLIGGWPGALLAQKTLRHKSKKKEFQTVFWATAALNCCALGWIFTKGGSTLLQSIINFGA